ncbi:hypothetical protein KDE41_32810, partial [Pseudomonas aeruginosa]|uniref:hypothetical protein n=1 Tax=Pseudomonas aeruginosa TaxID=287 RepID=UPI001B82E1C2
HATDIEIFIPEVIERNVKSAVSVSIYQATNSANNITGSNTARLERTSNFYRRKQSGGSVNYGC